MSTTMLDSYDTQMLDYHSHDPDVHMNVSMGSDSWTQEEAIMEDDGLYPTHKTAFENVSIEVDMEDYDENVIEYDMVNDTQHNPQGDEPHELVDVDVDVYDASQVHSPAVVSQPITDGTHTAVSYGTVIPQSTEDSVFSTAAGEVQPEDLESTTTPRVENLQSAAEEQGEGAPATDQVNITTVEEANIESKESMATGASTPPPPTASSENVSQVSNTGDDSKLDQSRGADTSDGQAHEYNVEPEYTNSSASDAEKHEVLHENSSQVAAYEDPHEILEGVYIDPPPSVLLAINVADRYEVSLFNDATAIVDSESKEDTASRIVLLQSQPTLYYEPLSSVFEAFRRDAFLTDIPGISEGELVLEALDLQLVMPEDNCYARGISLHDINVLHDACALTGPLRLNLRLDLPRFIIRYQRLQERVTQLIVEHQEVEPNQVDLPTTQDESGHVEYADNGEEELRPDTHSGDLGLHVPDVEHDEEYDNVSRKELQQETIVPGDGHELEPTEDSYDLEYVENAGTDAENTLSELKVPEAVGTADRSGDSPDDSVHSSDLKQAPAKAVGETFSIQGDGKGEIKSPTSRPTSPHASEKAVGDVIFASTTSTETERADDTGTNIIYEKYNLDEPQSEQSSPTSNYEAEDAHEITDSTLTHDIYYRDISSEEQTAIPTAELDDADGAAAVQWDDEFYEEGEADASWDFEANQEEEEEEQDSTSIESSVTLSSRLSSKRSFHELDENEDEAPAQSPGPKKLRTE
ncbi:hypothetical protein AX15_002948 [Amanita polypyramis BW_CC]|nr:hypothetical protein AX15_002948 [Amanita polypyramis BW_CC]